MNGKLWAMLTCGALMAGCEQPAPPPVTQPALVSSATTQPGTTITRRPKTIAAKPPRVPKVHPVVATQPATVPASQPASQPMTQPAAPFPGVKGVDAMSFGQPVANPFANIGPEYKAAMKLKGLDIEPLTKLKAVLLTGEHIGAYTKTFVNKKSDVLLVFGEKFITHGDVYSAGPVLAIGNAQFGGDIIAKGLVWLAEDSRPQGMITGCPIIIAPSVKHTFLTLKGEAWLGDYGWRGK